MGNRQNPKFAEALVRAKTKRKRAKEAMSSIVQHYSAFSNEPMPGTEVILDYLENMVLATELLLKALANDWREDGKSHFGHRVGDMYKEVFGNAYGDPKFMVALESAIKDQKFLHEPAAGILDYVPELEKLWDELTMAIYQRYHRQWLNVEKESTTTKVSDFLCDNIARFHSPTYRHVPREQRIQELRCHIQSLQYKLQCLEADTTPPLSLPEIIQRHKQREEDRIKMSTDTFRERLAMLNDQLSFSTLSYGMIYPGCLG